MSHDIGPWGGSGGHGTGPDSVLKLTRSGSLWVWIIHVEWRVSPSPRTFPNGNADPTVPKQEVPWFPNRKAHGFPNRNTDGSQTGTTVPKQEVPLFPNRKSHVSQTGRPTVSMVPKQERPHGSPVFLSGSVCRCFGSALEKRSVFRRYFSTQTWHYRSAVGEPGFNHEPFIWRVVTMVWWTTHIPRVGIFWIPQAGRITVTLSCNIRNYY